MNKRITVVLNEDIEKKLRVIQALEIRKSVTSVSFSRIVNEVLQKGLLTK